MMDGQPLFVCGGGGSGKCRDGSVASKRSCASRGSTRRKDNHCKLVVCVWLQSAPTAPTPTPASDWSCRPTVPPTMPPHALLMVPPAHWPSVPPSTHLEPGQPAAVLKDSATWRPASMALPSICWTLSVARPQRLRGRPTLGHPGTPSAPAVSSSSVPMFLFGGILYLPRLGLRPGQALARPP